jgi:hypothetical protein
VELEELDMLDDHDEKRKRSVVSFDISKWLPYVLIVGGWLIAYGRDSSGTENLKKQVEEDHASTKSLIEKVGTVSEHLARVEGLLIGMKEDQDRNRK